MSNQTDSSINIGEAEAISLSRDSANIQGVR